MPSIDDDDLSFEDGNLAISAKDRTNGNLVFFRVHKSILGKHSPVFRDMYSVPPPQDVDQHNGVPLVHVHDDADDLRHFLKAIYDPRQMSFSSFPWADRSKIPLTVTASQFSALLPAGPRYTIVGSWSAQIGHQVPGRQPAHAYHLPSRILLAYHPRSLGQRGLPCCRQTVQKDVLLRRRRRRRRR